MGSHGIPARYASSVRWVATLMFAVAMVMPISATRGATPQEVEQAIAKAKSYIEGLEVNGSWEAAYAAKPAEEKGGPSALATYALLAAGESPQDPRIKRAVAFLLQHPTEATYAVSMRCQVWLNLGESIKPDVRQAFEIDEATLLKAAHPDLDMHEAPNLFYSYTPQGADWDHSNSQYGVLGMWACAQAGVEISNAYWQAVDYGWRGHQFPDGGWSYEMSGGIGRTHRPPAQMKGGKGPSPLPTHSMTEAGIATLFITDEYLRGNDGINCGGNIVDPNIEAGLKWMGEHYKDVYEHHTYYTIYGIERIGVASGYKYFGTIDWYKEGADYLVKHQAGNGCWEDLTGTAWGLLFLVRGRAPVVMNKLQYDINMHGDTPRVANWNQRPRDAANLTAWIGRQTERFLNWQIVNLKVPVEELHDAPILYIAGNQALDFTDDEYAKLRQFVEEGGLILANADCGSASFCKGVEKVSKKLFPPYEFRDLPANSPIYTNQQFTRDKWKAKPKIQALSNGARELIILIPTVDPARFWQTKTYGGREEFHQLADDIFLYTVDRGDKGGVVNKGENYIVIPNPSIHAGQSINVARLEFAGNWDPEPGGWRRLNAILHNTQNTDLAITPVRLGAGMLNNSYKVAHLTGTFRFSLTPGAQDEIKKYVDGGGTLIVDACGGDAEFAESAEKQIAAIFPADPLPPAPLPLDSPAYAAGTKLESVEYRSTARKIVGKLSTPRIRGLSINGRLAVFFSSEDLSCGMVGMLTDGIYGYQPASAMDLMEKLVLFANK